MRFFNKKYSIFLILFCFFINCKKSKTKDKVPINIERKQRILSYKITVDSLNKTLDWKKTNFEFVDNLFIVNFENSLQSFLFEEKEIGQDNFNKLISIVKMYSNEKK